MTDSGAQSSGVPAPDAKSGCPECGMVQSAQVIPGVCPRCAAARLLDAFAFDLRPPNGSLSSGFPVSLGPFVVLGELGRGGSGVVYRARQVPLDREVALKVLVNGAWADDITRWRFLAEARAAAELEHPHIVTVYDFGEIDGLPFCAMRLLGGGTLAEAILASRPPPVGASREHGASPTLSGPIATTTNEERRTALVPDRHPDDTLPMTPTRVARILVRIAQAIQNAHEHGVIHRDLKPSNILLDEAGEPFITDFGLAYRLDGATRLTASGIPLGTPAYMAPEQVSGRTRCTTGTDIWGLGTILYELLAGRPPFVEEGVSDLLRAIEEKDPPAPLSFRPAEHKLPGNLRGNSRLYRDLETICLKCLSKSPSARYPTAKALAEDLERAMAGKPILARKADPLERLLRVCHRHPMVAFLGCLLGISVAILAVGGPLAAFRIDAARVAAVRDREIAQQADDRLEIGSLFEALNRFDSRAAMALLAQRLRQDPTSLPDADRALSLLSLSPIALPDTQSITLNGDIDAFLGSCIRWVATADRRQDIATVWSTLDGRPTWSGPMDPAHAGEFIAMDPGGGWFTVPRDGDVLEVLQLPGGAPLARLVCPGTHRRLRVSPDGGWLAVSGLSKVTRLFRTDSWTEVASFLNDTQSLDRLNPGPRIDSLRFSPDGSRLATGSFGGEVAVWGVPSGTPIATFRLGATVTSLGFGADRRFLAAAGGGKAVAWDLETRVPIAELHFPGIQAAWVGLGSEPPGLHALTQGGWYRRFGIGERLTELVSANLGAPLSDGLLIDEGRFLRAARSGFGLLWIDTLNGQPIGELMASPLVMAHLPDPLRADDPARVVLLERNQGTRSSFRASPASGATSPSSIPASTVPGGLASTRGPGRRTAVLRGWTAPALESPEIRLRHTADVISVCFSPNGRLLATVAWNGEARVWHIGSEAVAPGPRLDRGHSEALRGWRVRFSPDGSLLATSGWDRNIQIWDPLTGTRKYELNHSTTSPWWMEFSHDGKSLLTAGSADVGGSPPTGVFTVWDLAADSPRVRTDFAGFTWEPALSPDGLRWAAPGWTTRPSPEGGGKSSVTLMDAINGRPVAPPLQMPDEHDPAVHISCTAFSADGDWIAAGGKHCIGIWNARTLQLTWNLPHEDRVRAVRFHPDGRRFLSAGEDGSARLWDLRTGLPWSGASIMRHTQGTSHSLLEGYGIKAARFSPDGRWIATGAADHTARVWDAANGLPISAPLRHEGPVLDVQFSPDNHWLATASADHTARLWPMYSAGRPIPAWFPDLLEALALRSSTTENPSDFLPVQCLFDVQDRAAQSELRWPWNVALRRYLPRLDAPTEGP